MKILNRISIYLAALIALVMIFSSCGEPCIEGNGNIKSETRAVSNFINVTMLGDFDVFIEQSTVYEVVVEGDDNLLPYVLTENKSTSTLEIRNANNRCLEGTHPIKVYIKTPDLNRVTNAGSGFIKCDRVFNKKFEVINSGSGDIDVINLDTYDLIATMSGSGQIYFSGKALYTDMLLSVSGKIKAQDMDSDECKIVVSGSGVAYVFVLDYLNASVPGSGTVYYYGRPTTVVKRTEGSGDIIER
jgi:hypothetical protein